MIEQLREQLKEASLKNDEVRVGVLRMLIAALEYKKSQILAELSEAEILAVIKSEVKKRFEAMEVYKKAGAEDRYEAEKAEKLILEEFLPAQASEEEIKAKVIELKTELGGEVNKGQLIGRVIASLGKENVDGTMVARVVNEELE